MGRWGKWAAAVCFGALLCCNAVGGWIVMRKWWCAGLCREVYLPYLISVLQCAVSCYLLSCDSWVTGCDELQPEGFLVPMPLLTARYSLANRTNLTK